MMNGYIDIHTHILPGVDDGSGSMEETIRMLHTANEEQIRTIIATPHYFVDGKNTSVEQLESIKAKVQEEAYKINSDMRILLGNELYYSDSILEDLKSKKALTLADSRYILVEFSTRELYTNMYKGLGSLIRAGYIPIIAHIERYHCLEKKAFLISELIELGCYIQMNSNSLQGSILNSEARANHKLLNLGLIHFISSDCHDQKMRVPRMKSSYDSLRKKYKEETLNRLFYQNALNVIGNTYI